MFSLVKFHNDKLSVIGSKTVQELDKTSCVVKYNVASPYGKTKRCRWSASEKKAITSIFGDIMTLEKLPPSADCLNAIRQSPALCNRTPEQVKSWIDSQRKKDKLDHASENIRKIEVS